LANQSILSCPNEIIVETLQNSDDDHSSVALQEGDDKSSSSSDDEVVCVQTQMQHQIESARKELDDLAENNEGESELDYNIVQHLKNVEKTF